MKVIKWANTSRGLMVFVYRSGVWKWEKISAAKGQRMIEAGEARTENGKVWF